MRRPLVTEYTSHHASFVETAPYTDPLVELERQVEEVERLLAPMPEERGEYRYAPGKWSIKEIVGHCIDCERVYTCRCMAIARGETQPLPGFDQDAYVAGAGFGRRSLASLRAEFRVVRAASLALFHSLDEEAWSRPGVANERRLTARVIPWIAAGHLHHHLRVVRQRYL